MAEYIKRRFPDRFNYTFGDSTQTVPEFQRQNPDVKCDMISVDGGHTVPVATADLENFYNMSSHKNLVYYDNHPDGIFRLGTPWQSLKHRGKLTEYFRCRHRLGHLKNQVGYTFGQYF